MSGSATRTQAEIDGIKQGLAELKRQHWLRRPQLWWPDFLFHCTDVRNIVNILRTGEMLSRTQALSSEQLRVDIASPEVIAHTNDAWKDYVRLYFRPRTPTQYRNEGFRPVEQQTYHAQCPVPVYLLLDTVDVLSKAGVLFTDGSVANGAQPTDNVDFFKSIPFETVYHDTWFDDQDRDRIVYHRHAEILAPKRIDASAIRFVCCRSQAEYETLLNLLPPGTRNQWVDKVRMRPNLDLFFRKWCFVTNVEMNRESALFRFSVGDPPGPFKARAEFSETQTGRLLAWSSDDFVVQPTFRLGLPNRPQDYSVQLFLDEQLACSVRYQEEPLPF